MSDLILVEYDWQVRDLLRRGLSRQEKWIALGPYAMHELEIEGIKYSIPEDYYDEAAFVELRGFSQETTKGICEKGDNLIWDNCPEIKSRGLKPFLYHIIDITALTDGILWRIFQLQNIIGSLGPQRIYLHKYSPDIRLDGRIFFAYLDNLYSRILERMDIKAELHWFDEPGAPVKNKANKSLKYRIASRLMDSSVTWNLYAQFKQKGLKGVCDFLNLTGKSEIIIYGGEYNWRYCKDSLHEQGFNIVSLYDGMFLPRNGEYPVNAAQDDRLAQIFQADGQFRKMFVYRGVDWYPLVEKRINHLLYSGRRLIKQVYDKVKDRCSAHRPKAFLAAICDTPACFAASFAAKSAGVPVFTHQHGCEGYYKHFLVPYMDLMNADYFLTYGLGVNKTYADFAQKLGTTLVATGSVKADSLRNKKTANLPRNLHIKIEELRSKYKKIILYATTLYMHNFTLFRFTQGGPYSDRLLYRNQKPLIEGLLSLKGAGVIFKLIPVPCENLPDPPMLVKSSQLPGSCAVIKNEVGFIDLLPFADMVVLDEPSTTLVEAAVLQKPIFLLTIDPKIFVNGSYELIRRRAVCSERPRELVEFIDKYLISGDYPADVNDRSFVKEYSAYLDDGKSLDRVMDSVLQVTKC